ncbi:MAG: hypothetical protein LBE27_00090, partial [Deltaproteobacteria bacterium]|nr:hypothetical protein [Deltaproteobacteria bacterium]
MTTEYTGIDNHNEYYTNHYFYNILESNINAKIKLLSSLQTEDGEKAKSPWVKLRGYAKDFFVTLDKALKNEDPNDNLKLVEDQATKYLDALGYPKKNPILVEIDKDIFAPVFLHFEGKNGEHLLWVILSTYDIFPENIDKDNGQGNKEEKELENGEENKQSSQQDKELIKDQDILDKCAFFLAGSTEKKSNEDLVDDSNITNFSNQELISKALFKLKVKHPPRWIMLIGLNKITLVDRNKWNTNSYLSFNLEDILMLKDKNTLEAMTALLHRDFLCPQDGESAL